MMIHLFLQCNSLVEIYNERVRDLLTGNDQGRHLRVREHPHTGPYVDGESLCEIFLRGVLCHCSGEKITYYV